jgi:hypothetical protein
MLTVKITTQRATTGTIKRVLEEVCGALAGETFMFDVVQVDDQTLEIQAIDENSNEVF